ncbi:hypothetical protein ACFX14_035818 [Malus domestica]
MSNLSEDIIEDILSILPVKSVCRFRCVSKLWLHLTMQPRFIQAHLKRSQCKILLSSKNSLSSLDHLAPIDDDLLPLELDFPLKGVQYLPWVRIVGSCNGLRVLEVTRLPHHSIGNIKQYWFWIMKDYNVKESWTRILIADSYISLQPLDYWKNGKILLVRDHKELLLCNTKDGTCKTFLVHGLQLPFFAYVYVESLVSPNFQPN